MLAVIRSVIPSAASRSQDQYQKNRFLTLIAVVETATSHGTALNPARAWPVITAERKGM